MGDKISLKAVSMCKCSQVRKTMERSVNFKMFSRAGLKGQIKDSGACVGEKFICGSD